MKHKSDRFLRNNDFLSLMSTNKKVVKTVPKFLENISEILINLSIDWEKLNLKTNPH